MATSDGRPSGAGEPFDLTAFAGRVAVLAGTKEDTALRYRAPVLWLVQVRPQPNSPAPDSLGFAVVRPGSV